MDMSVSGKSCSVAAIDTEHAVSVSSTARVFYTASMSSRTDAEPVLQPTTCPFMSDHQIYEDNRLSIGLSRYPTATGQLIAHLGRSIRKTDLFSLDYSTFSGIMHTISEVAEVCRQAYRVQRCALVTEGGDSINIVPLHGLSNEWQAVTHDGPKEFHEEYPGYITSKDGPPMNESFLDEICRQIQEASGITRPFNQTFFGEKSDENLFSRIVRGELPQRRIWESEHHVAFLTPFANLTGMLFDSDSYSRERDSRCPKTMLYCLTSCMSACYYHY